jgi:hypothetical protein
VISPIFATTADAVAVLESPATAAANLGVSFEILARGRAGEAPVNRTELEADYVTNMTLQFTILGRGDRGIILDVLSGQFSLNSTIYTFDLGRGFAARPVRSELNVTAIFGFRINMTGPDDVQAQLIFLGGIKRTTNHGPVLVMRGRLIVGDQVFVIGQLGRIHRV